MTDLAENPVGFALPVPSGTRRRTRLIGVLGPALVAGVAYLDPGNVASNASAGSSYGFLLVWVVVVANLMAWLVQYLSAKLGLVTGASLADHVGIGLKPAWARRLYWVQAELVAVATDLAEITGGAIALALLFDLPLPFGGLITAIVSMIVLSINGTGRQRRFERVIIAMLAVITIGFGAGAVLNPPPAGSVMAGMVPRFDGPGSILLAASILGATVMPHAIYAHSALTRDRFRGALTHPLRQLLTITRVDVTIALALAGTVNLAILLFAAQTLHGVPGTDTLTGAYAAIQQSMGDSVATVFAIGLLASGFASTSVGAYAGSDIMGGLLKRRWPVLARRIITVIPALIVLSSGFDPTRALVLSQVVLSFGIPFALVPLIWLTARRTVMGAHVNRRVTTLLGVLIAALLISLNITLLVLTFG